MKAIVSITDRVWEIGDDHVDFEVSLSGAGCRPHGARTVLFILPASRIFLKQLMMYRHNERLLFNLFFCPGHGSEIDARHQALRPARATVGSASGRRTLASNSGCGTSQVRFLRRKPERSYNWDRPAQLLECFPKVESCQERPLRATGMGHFLKCHRADPVNALLYKRL